MKYKRCKKCGSYFLTIEEKIAPVEHSFVDSIGRALLLLIPIIGWIALINRKVIKKETTAVCTQCGYRKDITKKPFSNVIAEFFGILIFIFVLIVIIEFIIQTR